MTRKTYTCTHTRHHAAQYQIVSVVFSFISDDLNGCFMQRFDIAAIDSTHIAVVTELGDVVIGTINGTAVSFGPKVHTLHAHTCPLCTDYNALFLFPHLFSSL